MSYVRALDESDVPHVLNVLEQTTNPNPVTRNGATEALNEFAASVDVQLGYAPLLLNVAAEANIDPVARQIAAVTFKNVVKKCWDPQTSEHIIQEADKAIVRQSLFSAVLWSPDRVRRVLAEALTLVCAVDFPHSYGSVLDEIIAQLNRARDEPLSDPAVCEAITAALDSAHSVFTRYRRMHELTDETKNELLSINHATAETLVILLEASGAAASSATDPNAAKAAVDILRLTVEVLHDLTTCDLGNEHESSLSRIVASLEGAMQLDIPALVGDEYQAGPLIMLQAATLELVAFYMQQFDEDMEPFAQQLMTVVWQLLAAPSSRTSAADDLVVSGLNFFESTCRSVHRDHLLAALPQLCDEIVIPNLTISDADIENFEDDPRVYIQRDVEGSDAHTRRHSACQLVRGLMGAFPDQSVPILQRCIDTLVNTQTWQARDTAMTLITAMALRQSAASSIENDAAAVELTHAVDLATLYASLVEPELCSQIDDYTRQDAEACVVRADAVRFVATFRHFLPVEGIPALAGHLGELLQHKCIVLHTYAAHTIERLIAALLDRAGPMGAAEALAPVTPGLLELLCGRLREDRVLNEYTIKCLARLLKVASEASAPLVEAVTAALSDVLMSVAKNPSNPLFAHFLFESLAAAVVAAPEAVPRVEAAVWDALIYILREDVIELLPYALQLFAVMLDHHPSQAVPSPSTSATEGFGGAPIPDYYMELYGPLLSPAVFEHRGNVPAAVRLMSAFIRRNGAQLHEAGHTSATLQVAAKLLHSRLQDNYGFEIIGAFVLHYPDDVAQEKLPLIFKVLFDRLQQQRQQPSAKFSRLLALFCCALMASKGGSYFEGLMEHIQSGMTAMILTRVVLPVVAKVTGELERKTCAVGLSKLVQDCSNTLMNARDGAALWAQCVLQCLSLLHLDAQTDEAALAEGALIATEQHGRVEELRNMAVEESGIGSKFVALSSAVAPLDDPCGAVAEPRAFFRVAIKSVIECAPDQTMSLLRDQLPSDAFDALLSHVS